MTMVWVGKEEERTKRKKKSWRIKKRTRKRKKIKETRNYANEILNQVLKRFILSFFS